jgi:hypothetical protein
MIFRQSFKPEGGTMGARLIAWYVLRSINSHVYAQWRLSEFNLRSSFGAETFRTIPFRMCWTHSRFRLSEHIGMSWLWVEGHASKYFIYLHNLEPLTLYVVRS